MKQFTIPFTYRSPLIAAIKNKRRLEDKMKKDFTPTLLDFGPLKIYLARHFGFCYGVENAIEIAFRTVDENPGKRIFLLSEMIHNPQVNADLLARGVQFMQDTKGKELVPFEEITKHDVVIIPAFGTTLEMEKKLAEKGIATKQYNTTCPFVEKVWNRGEQIAAKKYSLVIHGKSTHEETRATFSHAAAETAAVVINDMQEAIELSQFITGEQPATEFYTRFAGRYSEGFDVSKDLQKIGVINQTTMLASDTQGIADFLKQVMVKTFSLNDQNVGERFADTRDTLCYATNDNQSAVYGLLEQEADLAIVVGGYNSSNTSHLVELCDNKLTTFFINDASKIISKEQIFHFNLHDHTEKESFQFLPEQPVTTILISSGASCPDAIVEKVIEKLCSFYNSNITLFSLEENFK
ncbi:MAG: 4-hydroxy-3-methylbut-2-enyl diphosphate reductase [Ferruginibacter sp.]